MSSARSKLGGVLLRPALRGLRSELDPEEQGGAVLLGLRGRWACRERASSRASLQGAAARS